MKQSQNKIFDEQMKSRLNDASVDAPAYIWDKVEKKLIPIQPWHKKYKYAILFLLFSIATSGSIWVYKDLLSSKPENEIALNKRLLKDDLQMNKMQKQAFKKSKTVKQNSSSENQSSSIKLKDSSSNIAVSSFYNAELSYSTNIANVSNNVSNAYVLERQKRLNKFEVTANDSITRESIEHNFSKNNTEVTKLKSPDVLPKVSKFDKNKTSITSKDKMSNKTKQLNQFSTAENKNENSVETTSIDDMTQPIVKPFHSMAAEPLTASLVPVKLEAQPLNGRDVLRSLIEPTVLERFDDGFAAAGINELNPNKEKMLKNLKQFAGYNINKGFHIGGFIAVNNVWLNKKDFSADENTLSINPGVLFAKAYGLNIGYDYTDRWGMELEWQMSEQGQKYKTREEAGSVTKQINLLYTKLPLLVKYKQIFINNYNSKPIVLSLLFGPQVGIKIKQHVTKDGIEIENAAVYNKVEAGILAGFDFDLFMTRNMYLTIGGRTGFASSFRKGAPMSFQLGVTTQLNFRFPKKIK